MNMYTINLFLDKKPESLVTSIDWNHIDKPVRSILLGDKCLEFTSGSEKKSIKFCFKDIVE